MISLKSVYPFESPTDIVETFQSSLVFQSYAELRHIPYNETSPNESESVQQRDGAGSAVTSYSR